MFPIRPAQQRSFPALFLLVLSVLTPSNGKGEWYPSPGMAMPVVATPAPIIPLVIPATMVPSSLIPTQPSVSASGAAPVQIDPFTPRDTIYDVNNPTQGNRDWYSDPRNNPDAPKPTIPPSTKTAPAPRPPTTQPSLPKPPGPPGTVPRPPVVGPTLPSLPITNPGPKMPPGMVTRPPVTGPIGAAVLTPVTITVGGAAVVIYIVVKGATESSIQNSCNQTAQSEINGYVAGLMQTLNPDQTDNLEACLALKTDPSVVCDDGKPAFCANPGAVTQQVVDKLKQIVGDIEQNVGMGRDCAMSVDTENSAQLISQIQMQITQFCAAADNTNSCVAGRPFLDASGKQIEIVESSVNAFCKNHPGAMFTRLITFGEYVQRTPHTCPCQ